jgi:hypothetical protein
MSRPPHGYRNLPPGANPGLTLPRSWKRWLCISAIAAVIAFAWLDRSLSADPPQIENDGRL